MSDSTPDVTDTSSDQAIPDSQTQSVDNTADTTVVTETPDQAGESTRNGQDATTSPDKSTVQTGDESAAQFDNDLTEWAKTRGIEVSTDNEKKLAQMARDNQRDFHKKRTEESVVDKQVDELFPTPGADEFEDPTDLTVQTVLQNQAKLEAKLQTRDYFDANPDDRALEPKMVELVQKEIELRGNEAGRWLLGDLNRLAGLARASTSESDKEALVEQTRQEERESLAKKQSAAAPNVRATTNTEATKPDGAQVLRDMPLDEYRAKKAAGWNPIRDL